jgi:DNA-directed RNA polymerase specialized sigma24 family protein
MNSVEVFAVDPKTHAFGDPFRNVRGECSEIADVAPVLSKQRGAANGQREHPMIFVERFWRFRDSLLLIAGRVLGSGMGAEEAVENCFFIASLEPPKFASEGAFGCWLVRILIDQVLIVRQQERREKALASDDKLAEEE